MASSLEELLAKEGFGCKILRTMSRASFESEESTQSSRPAYASHNRSIPGSSKGVKKTERTKSDVPRNSSKGKWPKTDGAKGTLPKKEASIQLYRRGSLDLRDSKRSSIDSAEYFPDNGTVKATSGNEIVQSGVEDDGKYKNIYSNEIYDSSRSKGKHSNGNGEKERYRKMFGKDMHIDKRHGSNLNKHLIRHSSSCANSENRKIIDDSRNRRRAETEQSVVEPALDEVAVRAMISILSGYLKPFLKDEDFRLSLRHNSFASLNFVGSGKGLDTESKVIANLEQAIDTAERAAEESASAYDLKKTLLQLSVITGINATDLRDGFTSGIRNSNLSACAHLYLGVIYKIQKKDRMSAKHILQMFCDSPFPARTILLPELWEFVFFPHLSHLKVWYKQEAESLDDNPSKARKLKLLEKVYNEILDSGTYQFAVYYIDWLTEGVEAPSIPSIQVPSVSVRGVQHEGLISHSLDPLSPEPMISKKLYETVFSRLDKPGAEHVENYTETADFDASIVSSNSSTVEDKRTLTYSDVNIDRGGASHPEDGRIAVGAWGLDRARSLGDNEKVDNSYMWQGTSRSSHMLHALPSTKANELTLKKLAQAVFKMQQTDKSGDLTDSTIVPHSDDATYPDTSPTKMRSFDEDLHGNFEYFHGGCFSSSIPQDFTCPLTGFLFDDPVTLETGQNFDRKAITAWFEKGNKTCPVTGIRLESQAVPKTNFILKRIVDSWKSEYCRNLFAFAVEVAETSGKQCKLKDVVAIFILDQLLTVFSKKESIINANLLISLGGLKFLIRRFEYGNLEEKTCVASMLCCCIKADPGCRAQIARDIEKPCFLELLHSNEMKSRANAVLLLTELICLNRRKDVKIFLSGLQHEGIVNTMHALLVHLQSCTVELKPLVAVLLLHLDLLVEPKKYSIYREEAVDALTVALESCLLDEKVREKCCKALLILGEHFSFSGKIMTEDWFLKQSGFLQGPESEIFEIGEDKLLVDEKIPLDGDEEEDRKEWLLNLSISLLADGKRYFLEAISKHLVCDNLDLVRVCLVTVTWFSSALASLPNADLQLFAFSILISPLKECLENDFRVEHKILASTALLNFSKIPGCRILLMTIAEDISDHLRCLGEVTWTAKELLYCIIFHQDRHVI
ncbi:hypothetical protein LguiB_001644 [Lonicera macranthoides]